MVPPGLNSDTLNSSVIERIVEYRVVTCCTSSKTAYLSADLAGAFGVY